MLYVPEKRPVSKGCTASMRPNRRSRCLQVAQQLLALSVWEMPVVVVRGMRVYKIEQGQHGSAPCEYQIVGNLQPTETCRAGPCLAVACDCSNRQCPAFMRRGQSPISCIHDLHGHWLTLAGPDCHDLGPLDTRCGVCARIPALRCRWRHGRELPPDTENVRTLTGQTSDPPKEAR